MSAEILVVDDELDIRELIGGILEDEGYQVRTAGDADSALAALRDRKPAAVVLDIWLQGSRMDGLDLLAVFRSMDPDMPVIVISGHGTIETAVSSIRKGAYDFIEKPFKSDRLLHVVSRALEAAKLKRENDELRAHSILATEIVGSSPAIVQTRQSIERIAAANSRVLIFGPAGSGKELVARLIHERSTRRSAAFVAVNAAAIEADRMESELFGEEGDDGRIKKVGLFEQAHGGTLFFDEVGEMPKATQSKILRVLIEQRFKRLNGETDVQVNVRVLSSTARDLRHDISTDRFREDLYHRLNVVPVRIPSLAERREDIPELVDYFVRRLSETTGLSQRYLSAEALAVLQAAEWPGNVRQLRNLVERILILCSGDVSHPIRADQLPQDVGSNLVAPGFGAAHEVVAMPLRDARERFERHYLAVQITRFGGNISRTAQFIGLERSALHRKLKSLGVESAASEVD